MSGTSIIAKFSMSLMVTDGRTVIIVQTQGSELQFVQCKDLMSICRVLLVKAGKIMLKTCKMMDALPAFFLNRIKKYS